MFGIFLTVSGIIIMQIYNFYNNFFKVKNVNSSYLVCKSDVMLRKTAEGNSFAINTVLLTPVLCLAMQIVLIKI